MQNRGKRSLSISRHPRARLTLIRADSKRSLNTVSVVLDMYMPNLNGLEVQARLATARRCIPLLFITAHDNPALRAQALAGGAAGYFDKPVRKEILLPALYKAVKPGSPTAPES